MKTPGEIAVNILFKSRYETGKTSPFYDHDIKIIAKEIMVAIEADRAELTKEFEANAKRIIMTHREIEQVTYDLAFNRGKAAQAATPAMPSDEDIHAQKRKVWKKLKQSKSINYEPEIMLGIGFNECTDFIRERMREK